MCALPGASSCKRADCSRKATGVQVRGATSTAPVTPHTEEKYLLGSGFAVVKGEELHTALSSPVRGCAGIAAMNYLCCASEMSGQEKGREVGVR